MSISRAPNTMHLLLHRIKELSEAAALAHPKEEGRFVLDVDGSDVGLSRSFYQEHQRQKESAAARLF